MSCEKLNDSSLNKKILKELRLTSQEHMLFNCMDEFYNKKDNKENAKRLISILEGEISIRLIDFFVTNYANKNRVSFKITDKENTIVFNVHSSYKSQLKAWKKIHFDPFSRGTRIPFFFNDNEECMITTIGNALCCFKDIRVLLIPASLLPSSSTKSSGCSIQSKYSMLPS